MNDFKNELNDLKVLSKELLKVVLSFVCFVLVIMLTWNWIVPVLFSLPTITFWQACGLRLLVSGLFRKNPYKQKKV